MKKFLLGVLPFLLFLSCSNGANNADKKTADSDTVLHTDTLAEPADSMDESEDEEASSCGVEEEEEDTTDTCFKLAPEDIANFKKILGDDVISGAYRSVEFKMGDDMVGSIRRDGGCGDDYARQGFVFKVTFKNGVDRNNINYIKNFFTEQVKRFPWNMDDEILYFLKGKFRILISGEKEDQWVSDVEGFTLSNFFIKIGDDYAELYYDWEGM